MTRRAQLVLLLLAFALRLGVALLADPLEPYRLGRGDTWWYLHYGVRTVLGGEGGLAPVPSAPLLLAVLGVLRAAFAPGAAVVAYRVLAAAASAATVLFGARVAFALSGSRRAGWVSGLVLALAPALVLEANAVATETLYIAFVMAALMLATETAARQRRPHPARFALVGGLLGLGALTRAVLLLFPVGLALHALAVFRRRRAWLGALALLVAYAATVGVWTTYNAVVWNRFVVGAQGYTSFLYLGAAPQGWQGYAETDAALAEALGRDIEALPEHGPAFQPDEVLGVAARNILADVPGYARRRATELARAMLQPHATERFPGPSLRAQAADWWRGPRDVAGLVTLVGQPGFWPKLAIYLWHYGFGALGAWGLLRAWRARPAAAGVLGGFILYVLLVHLALLALPRYMFPALTVLWACAGVGVILPPSTKTG